ncbi:hypothetical protein TpMuguga_04g00869 [Theileria parva strain Muguga]|uniref:Phorbol-ester/DAG-type domain-containing protein n=1 Tax=Theileria parva TaxID=5875 RepID=Q4N180_THEPA|nr:uncharacterized protein TpMuguga_04g00869 [Theileria parva strain Muguga]EAN32223.1 hypothetical protein TpMuguga_04g00869 [Theileria parva strain Muguga]|eukprot:XP_764506.1 hypothetical protein [Theileria parva strain Muguga]
MSTNVAVSLFLQRLLHEKYMEDSDVDSLIQGVIRGTGLSFSSKSAFIEHTNNLLSDIGFMLVRVNVAGKKYYSLKDLDSSNLTLDIPYRTDISENPTQDDPMDVDFMTPVRKLGVEFNMSPDSSQNMTSSVYKYPSLLKINQSKFTHSELMIFIDSINSIISTGKPLPIKRQESQDSWSSICSKRLIVEEPAQLNLIQRFERRKWLQYYEDETSIAPGVRFYFDLSSFFDLNDANKCESCSSIIIFNEFFCQECRNTFHEQCASVNSSGFITDQTKCFSCSVT